MPYVLCVMQRVCASALRQFSTAISQFAYCLRLTALRFCTCYGLKA